MGREDRITEIIKELAGYAANICQIAALLALIVPKFREKLFGMEKIREGQRCLLRSEIVHIYYRNKGSKQLKEYEYKNLESCYKAYTALGGNSFIVHIYAEMQEWDII